MHRERLQFRREYQVATAPSIVERFLAEPVATKAKRAVLLVPHRKGEHARKAPQRRRQPPLPHRIKQRFGVGMAAPVGRSAARIELLAYLQMVVDLAVKR